MVDLWAPVPLWLSLDGGARALPGAARAALYDVAMNGGAIRCGDDAAGALDALCRGAGASIGEMLARGLVEHRGGMLSLLAPVAVQRPTAARNDLDAGDAPSPMPTPRTGPPSWSPERARERKVRALFGKRAGICRDVPQGVEWAAWSTSPEGVAVLKVGRSNDVIGNKGNNLAGVVLGQGNNPGNNPGTRQEQPGNNPLSDSLPSEKEERRENSEAREEQGNNPSGTREQGQRNNPGTTHGNNPPPASPKGKRGKGKPAPYVDTPPMLGTLAHRVYLAIINDPLLCPIVGNPGDFAARLADPDAYPGVDVLAEVKRAGGFVAGKPAGHWTDGRAALARWMRAEAEKVAARPKPADARPVQPARVVEAPPVAAPLYIVPMTPEQKARQPRTLAEYEARVEAEEAARKAAENGR